MRGERMRVVGVDQVRVGRPQRPLARVPLWGPGERVFGDGGGVGHPGIAGVAGVRDDGDAESVAPAVVEAGQPLSLAGSGPGREPTGISSPNGPRFGAPRKDADQSQRRRASVLRRRPE